MQCPRKNSFLPQSNWDRQEQKQDEEEERREEKILMLMQRLEHYVHNHEMRCLCR